MSIFDIFRKKPIGAYTSYGPGTWNPLSYVFGNNFSGVKINHESSMRAGATWACVRLLSETVGSLPIKVYKRVAGGKEEAPDHPLYPILHGKPNRWQTSMSWQEMMQGHLVLRGNSYSEIKWKDGKVEELIPLNPERVTVERIPNGELRYKVQREPDKPIATITQANMLHMPGLSFDGLVGLSPIQACAQAFGVAIAAETYGATFFGNGTRMGNVLMHPATLSKEAREGLKKSLQEKHGGPQNANKTLILEEDMKWMPLGIKPNEAQFIETRKFSVTEIARIFRIPPHMIGDLEKATFSNIEQQSLEFVKFSIRPWLIKWEQWINKKLLLDSKEFFVEFLVDALLRADMEARYKSYEIGVNGQRGGFLTVNEVRAKENLNPIEGQNDIREPLNAPAGGFEGDRVEDNSNEDALAVFIDDAAAKITTAWSEAPKAKDSVKFAEKHKKYICKTLSPIAKAFGKPVDILIVGEYVDSECTEAAVSMIERALHVEERD